MLAEELRKIVKGEVKDDAETLKKFSRDASIFEVRPEVVVAPRDSEDIKNLVKFASDVKKAGRMISLTARSGGTDMSGGPLTDSIVVDMAPHVNQIHDIGSDYVVTDPGVQYRDLDEQTKRCDLFMPAYPASRETCTVGGMVANNSGGEKTLAYGKVDKFVMELSVVLSDGNEYVIKPLTHKELEAKMKLPTFEGELYKQIFQLITNNQQLIKNAKPQVSKNSAGYYLWDVMHPDATVGAGETFDLTKLIVGSQGTLGIVTKIKFRLVKVKKFSKMAVMILYDLSKLGDIVADLVTLKPESLEAYDDKTLKLALKFFPDILKVIKRKSLFKMVTAFFPQFVKLLFHGMPKLVMMVEFTGDTEAEIDAKLAETLKRMTRFGTHAHATKTLEEAEGYWTVRRESFNLLRHRVTAKQSAPFIDDVVVLPEHLPEFLPKLNQILARYNLVYTLVGHAGDGNFHIIPLMSLADPAHRALIPKISEEVYNLVIEYKGSITAEHNDGLIRTPYLEKMYGPEMIKLFEEVKKIFDPLDIFNPGKKVHGSLPYALSHIKKN